MILILIFIVTLFWLTLIGSTPRYSVPLSLLNTGIWALIIKIARVKWNI